MGVQKLQSIFSASANEEETAALKVEQADAGAQEPSDEEFFEAQNDLHTAAEASQDDDLVEVMQVLLACTDTLPYLRIENLIDAEISAICPPETKYC